MSASLRPLLIACGAASLLGVACNGSDSDGDLFGDGSGNDDGGDGGPGDGGGDDGSGGDGGDGGDDGDDGVRFDIGDPDDGTGGPGDGKEGCAKIDFLFVVDNSGSMGAHQTNLIGSFGPFMDTIFSTVEAQDYNIMVVDSDAGTDLSYCAGCNPACGADYCNTMWGMCESTLGAGEIAPYTCGASNRICGIPDDKRYINSSLGQAQIKDLFACMAQVGTCGSGGEMPFSAMVEAVTTQAQGGTCNDGFLRDDAVLVVTVITDDYPVTNTNDDSSTNGTINGWYDALVQAKLGKPDHVVMLGIINLENSTCVQDGSAGGPAVHPTQKFIDFVELFGNRGIIGDVCSQPDYSSFFNEAVGLIDTACDEFVPEG